MTNAELLKILNCICGCIVICL